MQFPFCMSALLKKDMKWQIASSTLHVIKKLCTFQKNKIKLLLLTVTNKYMHFSRVHFKNLKHIKYLNLFSAKLIRNPRLYSTFFMAIKTFIVCFNFLNFRQ